MKGPVFLSISNVIHHLLPPLRKIFGKYYQLQDNGETPSSNGTMKQVSNRIALEEMIEQPMRFWLQNEKTIVLDNKQV